MTFTKKKVKSSWKVMWSSSILIKEHIDPLKWSTPHNDKKLYLNDRNGKLRNVLWLKIIKPTYIIDKRDIKLISRYIKVVSK